MILTGTFHPPAGGTAWSFVLFPQTSDAFIGLLGGTLLLSFVTLGGKDSIVLHFLLYFYGTPFHKDTPVDSINDIEETLEKEYKIIESYPLLDDNIRNKRILRNEKIRRLMLLVLEDQIKDKKEEQKLIYEVRQINQELEDIEGPDLSKLDKRMDKALDRLYGFVEEFGEE